MKIKPQNPNIDFGKTVDTDEIGMIEDYAKGVISILNSMELASDSGTHAYQKHAYYVLQVCLSQMLDEMEELKPKIEYMDNFMRYETIGGSNEK